MTWSDIPFKPATKVLRQFFKDYLGWLDEVTDSGDYFTPAYNAMKESGIVRAVQEGSEPVSALAGDSGWSRRKQS